MKKFLTRLLLVSLALFVIAFLARNMIARKSVEMGVTKITGFPMEIESVSLQLFSSKLDVRDVRLTNPPEFEDKSFVNLPRLYIDYKLGSMIMGKPHIKEMIIEVEELVIVKNANGETNANKLKGVFDTEDESEPEESEEDESSLEYRVDTLHLKIGTIRYKDYSKGTLKERNIPLNIDATYNNIDDPSDIAKIILVTAFAKAGIPDLGIDMTNLKKGLDNVQDAAGDALKGTVEGVENVGKGLLDSIKNVIPKK